MGEVVGKSGNDDDTSKTMASADGGDTWGGLTFDLWKQPS